MPATNQSAPQAIAPSRTQPTTAAESPAIVHPATQIHSRAESPSAQPKFPSTHSPVPQAVLMITAIPSAESCAANLAAALGVPVEIASSRKLGLSALRRHDYATVIVDDSIAESDPAGTDLIWKHSGLAVPLQINFALVGCARLGREVKAALARREHEQSLAMRAATSSLENDLKSTVTGLLLQSELALSEPSVPPQLASKLRLMVELAGTLRRRLEQPRL